MRERLSWARVAAPPMTPREAASTSTDHFRALLQGDAPESTLPNLLRLPSCSIYGSHDTTWLRRNVPRLRGYGLPSYGDPHPVGIFDPMSSSYTEPLIALMIWGLVLWTILGIVLCCFCYRRYHLGLCGEPIPTVKRYTPQERRKSQLSTFCSFLALMSLAGLAGLVVQITLDIALDAFYEKGSEVEDLLRAFFDIGGTLLESALSILNELEIFGQYIALYADVEALPLALNCTARLLSTLPNGSTLLAVTHQLAAAVVLMPPLAVTETAFSNLDHVLSAVPEQGPPFATSLLFLDGQIESLPDLQLLGSRLSTLNESVVNMTGAPAASATTSTTSTSSSAPPKAPPLIRQPPPIRHRVPTNFY